MWIPELKKWIDLPVKYHPDEGITFESKHTDSMCIVSDLVYFNEKTQKHHPIRRSKFIECPEFHSLK